MHVVVSLAGLAGSAADGPLFLELEMAGEVCHRCFAFRHETCRKRRFLLEEVTDIGNQFGSPHSCFRCVESMCVPSHYSRLRPHSAVSVLGMHLCSLRPFTAPSHAPHSGRIAHSKPIRRTVVAAAPAAHFKRPYRNCPAIVPEQPDPTSSAGALPIRF